VIAYKFLRLDGTSVFTGFSWPLPNGGPGSWVEAEVEPCRSGVHPCRSEHLPLWAGQTLYEVELGGQILHDRFKGIAGRARLIRRIEAWEDVIRDSYTRMCADRARELARGASPRLEQWEAAIEPSVPEGPALLGFMAARIAEESDGPEAYQAERARQTESKEVPMSTKQLSNDAATVASKAAAVQMRLEAVGVPVADVDRAKRFYQRLGWRVDPDVSAGDDYRLVHLTPPGPHRGAGLDRRRGPGG
jgi:hypothetical protein